jgi:hypothetical protein
MVGTWYIMLASFPSGREAGRPRLHGSVRVSHTFYFFYSTFLHLLLGENVILFVEKDLLVCRGLLEAVV